MPYKHEKLQSMPPHRLYPVEDVEASITAISERLHLAYEPVAVTFLFTTEDYDACPVQEVRAALPYCVMVKQAAVNGRAVKSRAEHHKCDDATTALALEPSTEKIESGQEYFSYGLYASTAAARRMRSGVKSLHREPVHTTGIVVQPLRTCSGTPDVVIQIVNPWQAMRFLQGSEYSNGIKPSIDMGAMQGMCSEVTVVPYLTGEMNVSVLCPSTRMLCKWSENDMAVGIPFERYAPIAEGVCATQSDY